MRSDSVDEPFDVAGLLLEALRVTEREDPEDCAARVRLWPDPEPPDDALRDRLAPLRAPVAGLREPLPLPLLVLREPPLALRVPLLRDPPLALAARELLPELAARVRLPAFDPPPELVLRELLPVLALELVFRPV